MQGVVGKTKGRVAEGPSVAGEGSALETISVATDSAVDLTGTKGDSAVVTTLGVSDVTVSVTVG